MGKKTKFGKCKLCDQEGELYHGHIAPAFGWRWLVTGKGGKFFNTTTDTLMTAQRRAYMFCQKCENELTGSKLDGAGSRLVMRFHRDPKKPQFYDENFYRWTVSLSLRALCGGPVHPVRDWPPARVALAQGAIDRWKAYLLGTEDGVGPFHQHAYLPFLGKLHRAINWTIYPDLGFTFMKFGPLVVFGLTKEQKWPSAEKRVAGLSLLTPKGGCLRGGKFIEGTTIPAILMAISDESNIQILEDNLASKTCGPQIPPSIRVKVERAIRRHRARHGNSLKGG
jgi:hypothetical protein